MCGVFGEKGILIGGIKAVNPVGIRGLVLCLFISVSNLARVLTVLVLGCRLLFLRMKIISL